MWWLAFVIGCAPPEPEAPPAFVFPELHEGPGLRGPGGPSRTFPAEELLTKCATLHGGPEDNGYHNLVVPYRGHLVMPWAPEWGLGGLSFFDFSDPCAPVKVADSFDETMREPHSIGWAYLPPGEPHAGEYAFVAQKNGLLVWDVTDLDNIHRAGLLNIEGVFWPDAYARVVLSVSVQFPYVFLGTADHGVYVVDASDPTNPTLLAQHVFDPLLRTTAVFALGGQLVVVGSKIDQAAVLDISNPAAPMPWPGSPFHLVDGEGGPLEPYHANLTGDWLLLARKNAGGGPVIYNVSDPANPAFVGDLRDTTGSGGYLYYHEGFIFQGETHHGNVYDARDPEAITLVSTVSMVGDNDTFVPYGNVAILAVDDGGVAPEYSNVIPWAEAPDSRPPVLLRTEPAAGATGVPVGARIGFSFDEMIEPGSFFMGSVRLFDSADVPVPGWTSVQEGLAHYAPKAPLARGETYRVELLAGGVADASGNAITAPISFTFTTVGP